MRRQSNPITPLELFWSKFNWTVYFLRVVFRFRFIACIQRQSCSKRFIFLHLSTLLRTDFPGCHVAKKTFPTCFVLSARTTKFFFTFSFMAHANLATSPKRLETELTNITRRHFCSLPVFCIEHSFTYFFLSEVFPVICLFWHTLTARDDTPTRQHTRQGRK